MSFICPRNFFHLRNCIMAGANIRRLRLYSNKSLSKRCTVFPLSTFSEMTRRQGQTLKPQIIKRHVSITFPLKKPKITSQCSDPIHLYQKQEDGGTIDKPATVLVLDLGTTGLSSTSDRITEIAVRDLNGGNKSMFHTLINPAVPLKNRQRNRILTESTVPRIEEAILLLVEWVKSRQIDGKPVVLVAHNGHCFDFRFLVRAFHRCSYRVPEDWLFVDSLPLARQLCHHNGAKLEKGNHKLKDLVKFFNVVVVASAQRATVDVNALSSVFQKITFDLKLTVTDLMERASKAPRYY